MKIAKVTFLLLLIWSANGFSERNDRDLYEKNRMRLETQAEKGYRHCHRTECCPEHCYHEPVVLSQEPVRYTEPLPDECYENR